MILICECFINLGLGVMMMMIIFEVLCLGLVFLGKRMGLFGWFSWSLSLCENLGYEYQFLLIMNEIDNEYKHSRSFIITKAIFRIILIEML